MARYQIIFHFLSGKLVFICFLVVLGPWLSYAFLLKGNTYSEFGIIGPDRVCLITGNTLETFTAGGNPLTDVYRWEITEPDGNKRTTPSGSGFWANPTLDFTFSKPGDHRIKLIVRRPGIPEFSEEKIVPVIQGPSIVLESSYSVCIGQEITLRALDPATPNLNDYIFEWTDENGDAIGSASNEIKVSPGKYAVTYYFINSDGARECENSLQTIIEQASDFELEVNSSTVCPGGEIRINPSETFTGAWYYQIDGGDKVFVRNGRNLVLNTSNLPGIGQYTVYFEVINPSNPDCQPIKTVSFVYNPNPDVIIEFEDPASDCTTSNGSLRIEALTDIDWMYFVIDAEEEIYSPGFSMSAGDVKVLTDLPSGVYIFEIFRGGCFLSSSTFIPLADIPLGLDFKVDRDLIVPETCAPDGKNLGSFTVSFPVPPQDLRFELYNQRGGLVMSGEFDEEVQTDFTIEVAGGVYFLEIFLNDEDLDDDEEPCKVPNQAEIEVPALEQVEFIVPQNFNFCGFYELIPIYNSIQNLEFSLVDLDNPSEPERVGQSFIIDKPGNYAVIGRNPDFPNEICPRKIDIAASIVDPVIFEEIFVSQDCQGNQVWEVKLDNYLPSQVRIRWLNELGQPVSTSTTMRPVTYGNYSLEVQPLGIVGACPDAIRNFFVPAPVLSVDGNLNFTPLCPLGPDAIITLDSDFDNIGRIVWRYFDSDGQIEELLSFENEKVIIGTKPGTYEVAVFNSINTTCEIGRETIEISISSDLTDFDVPNNLMTVCEFYDWIPITNFELEFELLYPNGTRELRSKGEAFRLDQNGEYLLRGIPIGLTNQPFCPQEQTFEIKVVSPIIFRPEFITRDCDGVFEYFADIGTADPDEVDFIWRNSGGNQVGSSQIFQTSIPGNYTLEVQPKGSLPCAVDPIPFEIEVPVLSLSVNLQADPFCPDASSTIVRIDPVDTDLYAITWVYISPTNDRVSLPQFDGEREIVLDQEGTYEVKVEDSFNCILAFDQILVLRSSDPVRPIVKETYQICREYEIGETISPGSFLTYRWILDEDLISTSSSFKPQLVGTWKLEVTSKEGCEYQVEFEVKEECELKVVLPNALILDDPNRAFLIYTNYLVDEIEVYIFNKWGQQVFNCVNKNATDFETTCAWDGYISGEKLLPGAYAVRVIYRNVGEKIQKNLNTTLTVF